MIDKSSKPWTRVRWLMLPMLLGSMLMGCAHISTTVKPPLSLPPMAQNSQSFEGWIQEFYRTSWLNCRTLSRLRGENPTQCDDPLIPVEHPE